MTEAEWLECNDPGPMLVFLLGKASDRKLRLFACACCRRIWPVLRDENVRRMAEIAEDYAEGLVSQVAVRQAQHNLDRMVQSNLMTSDDGLCVAYNAGQVNCAWSAADYAARDATKVMTEQAIELRILTHMLRDIFGNPFRPLTLDSTWQTPTVTSLATAAYGERSLPSGELDLARLAVLADALEEAGCQDQPILEHLRSPSPHVRGCWPLDLILGRA
jgi:hypothetical protein